MNDEELQRIAMDWVEGDPQMKEIFEFIGNYIKDMEPIQIIGIINIVELAGGDALCLAILEGTVEELRAACLEKVHDRIEACLLDSGALDGHIH